MLVLDIVIDYPLLLNQNWSVDVVAAKPASGLGVDAGYWKRGCPTSPM